MEAETLTFRPSRVEGVDNVESITVYPERLELTRPEGTLSFRFKDMKMRWYRFGWLYSLLHKLGFGIHGEPLVADRDWFHEPPERFFQFYTSPPITVYMPEDDGDTPAESTFPLVKAVMAKGGFFTSDLG